MGADLRSYETRLRLQIGDAADRERDRKAVFERLAADIRGITALADEIETRYREAQGKFDGAVWKKLMESCRERSLEIEKRALHVPEYRALDVEDIPGSGLEELRDQMLRFGHCAAGLLRTPDNKQIETAFQKTRGSLARSAQRHLDRLFPPRATGETLAALVADARKVLRDARPLEGDSLNDARRKFQKIMLTLDASVPPLYHEPIQKLGASATLFFDALAEKSASADALLADSEAQLEICLKAVGERK
jgi:hypothetical protein